MPGLLPILLLALFADTALAHDFWVERAGDLHTLHYGHERSGHEGASRLELQPRWVRDAQCFNAAGEALRSPGSQAIAGSLKGDCAASWFQISSGYWSKTPYGTKNLPRTEAGVVLDSWLSRESVKRIDRWGSALARPLSGELEIVPLDNPLGLKAGAKLRLAVYLRGMVVPGATVAYFGHPRGVSGADGRVNVRLQQPGLQLIQASLASPLADGKADRLVQGTALQFEISP